MPWDQVVEDFKNGKEVPNNKILSIFLRFKYDQAA